MTLNVPQAEWSDRCPGSCFLRTGQLATWRKISGEIKAKTNKVIPKKYSPDQTVRKCRRYQTRNNICLYSMYLVSNHNAQNVFTRKKIRRKKPRKYTLTHCSTRKIQNVPQRTLHDTKYQYPHWEYTEIYVYTHTHCRAQTIIHMATVSSYCSKFKPLEL